MSIRRQLAFSCPSLRFRSWLADGKYEAGPCGLSQHSPFQGRARLQKTSPSSGLRTRSCFLLSGLGRAGRKKRACWIDGERLMTSCHCRQTRWAEVSSVRMSTNSSICSKSSGRVRECAMGVYLDCMMIIALFDALR